MEDKPREECGVFGIYGPGLDVSRLTYYGLYALQHRGQESAGIAVADSETLHLQKGRGLVSEVFSQDVITDLKGHSAIGHVRHSATNPKSLVNAQPFLSQSAKGKLSVANNGRFTNRESLRAQLYREGAVLQTTSDGEIMANLLAKHSQHKLIDAITKSLAEIEGAYSMLLLTREALIGIRDPFGIRPLCLGKRGDAYVLASESCALDVVGAKLIRDIQPGEIIVINDNGITSHIFAPGSKRFHCVFEYIYFARADSSMEGFIINNIRREMGRQLAREYPVDADIVIPVPDSGTAAARGFANGSDISFEEGFIKNKYVGRTFIQPTQSIRDMGVRLKLNPIRNIIEGKRVIIVDDSIVRGTTSGRIVKMLREFGVKEVHFCISSPPVVKPCYYGINVSKQEELIACKKTLDGIKKHIGVDGLHYLSLDGLLGVFGDRKEHFCTACFSGNYPVEVNNN